MRVDADMRKLPYLLDDGPQTAMQVLATHETLRKKQGNGCDAAHIKKMQGYLLTRLTKLSKTPSEALFLPIWVMHLLYCTV